LERGRIDLGVMTSTFMLLLWRGLRFQRASHTAKTPSACVPRSH
jgi:hypothetical protein